MNPTPPLAGEQYHAEVFGQPVRATYGIVERPRFGPDGAIRFQMDSLPALGGGVISGAPWRSQIEFGYTATTSAFSAIPAGMSAWTGTASLPCGRRKCNRGDTASRRLWPFTPAQGRMKSRIHRIGARDAPVTERCRRRHALTRRGNLNTGRESIAPSEDVRHRSAHLPTMT
jgi:hypothetical protein